MYVGVDIENMPRRQMVLPLNYDRPVPLRLDRWTWILSFISPEFRRWQLRMHPLREFEHADAIMNPILTRGQRYQSFRKRQWIYISVQQTRLAINRLCSRTVHWFGSIHAIRKDQGR